MILSASGWRGIFALSGDEEGRGAGISDEHRIIAAAAAKVFSDYLKKNCPAKGAVIVGTDTRPTGPAIADAVIRTLLAEGWELRYTGISAAPEIMAYARTTGPAGDGIPGVHYKTETIGGVYISASHNPIGHNGIKFGLTDGGVLQAAETALLVTAFESFMADPGRIERAGALLRCAGDEQITGVYAASADCKKAAVTAYRNFTNEVISGSNEAAKSGRFFEALRRGLEKRPLGIAADFNGSARTVSIDREFFKSLGAGFYALNDKPGEIAHRIVPEGESLEPCRLFMEELHSKDPALTLGYVPDCDGDRGNLVIWDDGEKKARILEAQEVFALACVAELSSLVWAGELRFEKQGNTFIRKSGTAGAAISVNDPTSLRIDRIAAAFGAEVHRAEVGEANVVGLARKLREQGWLVRILGEGSSGGTITHPSAVRDPIDTLGAILKLLEIRDGEAEGFAGMGLFQIWCSLSDQADRYREDFTLQDIIASLPGFVSTGAYSEDALLKVKTTDHALLKDRYQRIFLREWEEKKDMLKDAYGISRWEAVAYNGMEERRGITRFGEAGRGGLKIEFFRQEEKIACIWMRGSGTEPVFRVMADSGSGRQLERSLIDWQRSMVLEADS